MYEVTALAERLCGVCRSRKKTETLAFTCDTATLASSQCVMWDSQRGRRMPMGREVEKRGRADYEREGEVFSVKLLKVFEQGLSEGKGE